MTYPENLHIIHLESVDSTNDYIKRNYRTLSSRFPVMVRADLQTSGRGRHDREWMSPRGGGLYTSFGFLLNNQRNLGLLPLVAGVSLVEILNCQGDENFRIKWPNDILYNQRKVAGILTETIIFGDRLTCICGIGVNVNQIQSDFPPHLQERAISLNIIHGHPFPIDNFSRELARSFFKWVEKVELGDSALITDKINHLSFHSKGDHISFHNGERTITGIFSRIESDGGLILQTEGGENSYYSGEIKMEKA